VPVFGDVILYVGCCVGVATLSRVEGDLIRQGHKIRRVASARWVGVLVTR